MNGYGMRLKTQNQRMDCDHLETTNGNIGLLVLVKLWFGISRGERELFSDIEKGNKEFDISSYDLIMNKRIKSDFGKLGPAPS